VRDLAYVLRKDKVIDRGLRVLLSEPSKAANRPAAPDLARRREIASLAGS